MPDSGRRWVCASDSRRRWVVLIALTLARTTMGLQFQSVAAVGPILVERVGLSYAALGTLIGFYLLPGVVIALPGGWLGQRFGDKRVVVLGLALMTAGGVLLAASDSYALMVAGRIVSGAGAVLLNVLVTKMVTDWFAGREIVSAMGVLLCSWPFGIALALVVLASLGETWGWAGTVAVTSVLSAAALLLVAAFYAPPPDAPARQTGLRLTLTRFELSGVLLAGLAWTFYNIAFIIVLSFGPQYLTNQGMSVAAAAAVTSLASWLIIPALPLGGWLAERADRPTAVMTLCFAVIACLIWLIPVIHAPVVLFALLGLVFGPPGGLIMALPSEIMQPDNRAVGMGIYFTCYYVGMGVFPALAGLARDVTGNPAAPLYFAGATAIVALGALIGLRGLQGRRSLASA
jgi:predicted MFS family arabinose efflux permease